MENACPPLETFLRADRDASVKDRLLAHAAGCRFCLRALEMVEQGMDVQAPGRSRIFLRVGWISAAAAASLLLVWGASSTFNGGRPSPAVQEAGLLADGTRLFLESGARLQRIASQTGERVHLNLLSGAVEAEVAPGKGLFRIDTPAGEVDVLGTRLRVHAFELKDLESVDAGRRVPCLCVEVYTGKALIKGAQKDLPVGGGERGILVAGKIPEKQALGTEWRTALNLLSGMLRFAPDGWQLPPARRDSAQVLAALLFGGRWKDPLDLQEWSDDGEAVRQARRWLREMR